MSRRFLGSARIATIVALCLALFVTGVVSGATGGNFILGVLNSATAQTAVRGSTSGNALYVENNSTGNGGVFVSDDATGIAGVTRAGARFALAGTNDGAHDPAGGAVNALGKLNHGVNASSTHTDADAVRGVNTGAVVGDGFADGVYGESRYSLGNGVLGVGNHATGPVFGVWGQNVSDGGVAVVGTTFGAPETSLAGLFEGDVVLTGTDIYADECFCTLGTPAVAQGAIAQGAAVTPAGVATAPDGRTVMVVRAAQAGERVVGVADRSISFQEIVKREFRYWVLRPGAAGAADGQALRIVTHGLLTYPAAGSTPAAGTTLAAGAGGRLAAAAADAARGTTAGYSLGASGGQVTIFVDPS